MELAAAPPSSAAHGTGMRLRAELEPAVGAARQARELVTEACARWELPDLVGPACTVVTELVNNAVVHARTSLQVLVQRRGDGLAVEVSDGSPLLPQPRGTTASTTPGGRGLLMVQAIAAQWGCTPATDGKTVWALVSPMLPA